MWNAEVVETADAERPYGLEVNGTLVATVISWEIAQWLSSKDFFIDEALKALAEKDAPQAEAPSVEPILKI